MGHQGICKKIQNKRNKKYVEETEMKAMQNYIELLTNKIPKDRHNERFKIKDRLKKKLIERKIEKQL